MTKKDTRILEFKVPCYFNNMKSQIPIYIGCPNPENNPIFFQNKIINEVKGGVIPSEIIESLEKLKNLSIEYNTSLQELCEHAFSALNAEMSAEEEQNMQEEDPFPGSNTETKSEDTDNS